MYPYNHILFSNKKEIKYWLKLRYNKPDLKNNMLSKWSQSQKIIYCTYFSYILWFFLYKMCRIMNSIDTECRLVFALGLGLEARKELGVTANGYGVSFKKNINVLKVVVIQIYVYSINHWIIHINEVNCTQHELFLNRLLLKSHKSPGGY